MLSVASLTARSAFAFSPKAIWTFPSASTILAWASATFSADSCDKFSAASFADSRFFCASSTFRSASFFFSFASLTFCAASLASFSETFWMPSAFFWAVTTARSAFFNLSFASFSVLSTLTLASFTNLVADTPATTANKIVPTKIAEPTFTLRSAFCFASSKMIALFSATSLACCSASNFKLLSTFSTSRLSRKKSSSASLSRLPRAHSSAFWSASPRNKKPPFCSASRQARNAEA